MEWNTKAPAPHSQWDWENSAVFPGKLCEISSPKGVQLADWAIEADVGTDNGSFHPGYLYLSGGGGCAGSGSGSGSDLGSGSSSKSSVSASASADSLLKAGIKNHPEFNFNAIESHGINGVKGRRDMGVLGLCCLVNSSLDMRDEGSIAEINSNVEQNGKAHHGGFSKDVILMKERNCGGAGDASLAQVASIGSGEALIGLKLGKRTYFEVPCVGSAVKASSFPEIPVPSPVSVKKIRASYLSMQNPRCQVEGCNLDLSSSKDYHRRHKVCESHSKSPKVTVAGQEQRFCQQCSRFHDLLEFDGKKRSCRRRLSDHNARRRKQQPEAISFNSTRLSSSLYDLDGRQQMNLVVDRVPLHTRALASPTWEGACDIKFTQQKGSWLRTGKAGNIDGQFHMPCAMDLSNAISVLRHDFGQPLPFKSTAAEVFEQGMEASLLSSNLTAAPDPQRALSLLSNSSWCSTVNEPISLDQLMHVTHQSITQPVVQALHQGLPLAGSVIWQAEQSVPVARAHSTLFHNSGNQFQEYQLFRVPYESAIFDSDQLQ